MLTIRIECDDDVCSKTKGGAYPGPQCATQSPVQDVTEPNGPLTGGKLPSAVAAAVIYNDERIEASLPEPGDDLDNGPLFIVGWDNDDNACCHQLTSLRPLIESSVTRYEAVGNSCTDSIASLMFLMKRTETS
jgi:hypothetical protein